MSVSVSVSTASKSSASHDLEHDHDIGTGIGTRGRGGSDARPSLILVTQRRLREILRSGYVQREAQAVIDLLSYFDADARPQLPAHLEDAVVGAHKGSLRDPRDFFVVSAHPDALAPLAEKLRGQPGVVSAYVKPACEPAGYYFPSPLRHPQGYLEAAPGGVDALFAWGQPGGQGSGVTIVDVEGGWDADHEAFAHHTPTVPDWAMPDRAWRDHGTGVFGILGGRGVITGICSEARLVGAPVVDADPGQALYSCFDLAGDGDIVLIEVHRAGPVPSHVLPALVPRTAAQGAYLPLEWWPDEWEAIAALTAKGRVVVEVAGNAGVSLSDDALTREPPEWASWGEFENDWENPFLRRSRDSHSILVGSGYPPEPFADAGYPDRARHATSNYGRAVDAQGWGEGVSTAGCAGAFIEQDYKSAYTSDFGGTSAAAAMVAGVAACVQGVLKAEGKHPLSSRQMRALLRKKGSAQHDAASLGLPVEHRVGPRPNLAELIDRARAYRKKQAF